MQDKEAVLKQIQAALEHEAHVDLQTYPIQMDYSDGSLILEGEVPHIGSKKLALGVAAAVSGVSGIVDRLRVTPAERPGDGAIRDAVCKWLLRDIDFRNCSLRMKADRRVDTLREAIGESSGSIEVSVEDGVVTLTGQVISLSHKRLAGVLAWWARGCRDLVNGLEVVPPEEDNDDEISDALHLVFETDPFVHADQIGITTRNGVVTLQGVVASEQERKRVEWDAWCLFAVDKVINHIEVRL
jgi:osmotically-inducible protein OsmY